jgi:hypothetical protein
MISAVGQLHKCKRVASVGFIIVMPSANPKQPELKQKTLLGFFNKSTGSTTSTSHAKPSKPAAKPKDDIAVKTPSSTAEKHDADDGVADTRKPDYKSSAASSFESYGSLVSSHGSKETPPTSDVIDIDMLSDLTDLDDAPVEKSVSPFILVTSRGRVTNATATCFRRSASNLSGMTLATKK